MFRSAPRVLPCLLALAAGLPASAQEAAEVTIPQENVRYDYATVLDARPVYQTLRTTKMERRCGDGQDEGRLARVVGAVKGAFGGQEGEDVGDCRVVPVSREYRRPIAYDVDYVYKGSRYRTRMDRDPGNRLRIRVSITPQPMR
jgi:uncharacterized protein YcfJ